jgi:hypothetical protein
MIWTRLFNQTIQFLEMVKKFSNVKYFCDLLPGDMLISTWVEGAYISQKCVVSVVISNCAIESSRTHKLIWIESRKEKISIYTTHESNVKGSEINAKSNRKSNRTSPWTTYEVFREGIQII